MPEQQHDNPDQQKGHFHSPTRLSRFLPTLHLRPDRMDHDSILTDLFRLSKGKAGVSWSYLECGGGEPSNPMNEEKKQKERNPLECPSWRVWRAG